MRSKTISQYSGSTPITTPITRPQSDPLRLDPNQTPPNQTPITTGLVRVLELLEEELVVDMALLGVTRVDQITPAYVCKAAPVTFPHEMSAFVHIPGGQLR